MGAGANAQKNFLEGDYLNGSLNVVSGILSGSQMLRACFAAGTPLLTPDGDMPIEQFRPGDWILSAPEENPDGPPEPRQVQEVFTNYAQLLNLHVGGKVIRTTSEHPFYIKGKGWAKAQELRKADLLRSHDGQWLHVQAVTDSRELAPVYNLRIADYHTYFVGSREWGFSVWAHNACWVRSTSQKQNFLKQLANDWRTPSWMKPWLKKGLVPPGYNVDHIIPGSIGGADLPSNMRLLYKADHILWHQFYHPWR